MAGADKVNDFLAKGRRWLLAIALGAALPGCALMGPDTRESDARLMAQLDALLPSAAILLGEQHDVPDHHRIEQLAIENLAARGVLGTLVLEMAHEGGSTASLPVNASEAAVRDALKWKDAGWSWDSYGPPIMAAVHAGVPVIGSNLAPAQWRTAMADATLEQRLPAVALQLQQESIRKGHCDLLPESQILPMTRMQIARDLAMARTLEGAVQPGKTALMLAGRTHVDPGLGIALHLPAALGAKTILLTDQVAANTDESEHFDQRWPTQPGPDVDYCAKFAEQRASASRAAAPVATPP